MASRLGARPGRMIAQACLVPGAIDGPAFAALLDHDLGFAPHTLALEGRDRRFGATAVEAVRRAPTVQSVRVESRCERQMLALGGVGGREVSQVLWQADPLPPGLELLGAVTRMHGFNGAWLSDGDDVHAQSDAGGFFPGEPEVDISGNPGRATAVDGIWLHAASTMWWGAGAFALLDRERLLAFPGGGVTERSDGVVRVDLFPYAWYAEDVPAMRARQQAFRDWMGFDALEARAEEIDDAEPADPHFELDTGTFPHGGVRRITEWLDATGAVATTRSRAGRCRVSELGPDGALVWREERPV